MEVKERGKYFEELDQDATYVHSPGRTISEADNTLFSTLTMNPASLHLDAVESAKSEFGERLVNSLLTLSTLVGLSVAQLTQGTTVANLGFNAVQFPRPVLVGDTLYARTTVTDKRQSRSRPSVGIVVFRHEAYNQRGELVAVAERAAMMKRLPEVADA